MFSAYMLGAQGQLLFGRLPYALSRRVISGSLQSAFCPHTLFRGITVFFYHHLILH